MNKDLRHYVTLAISSGLKVPLGIFYFGLLARALGPSGMGQWAMIGAMGTLLHSALLNWTQAPAVRFGREEWDRTHSLQSTWANRWPMLLIGAIAILALLVLNPLEWLKKLSNLPSTWWPLVLLYLIGLWLTAEVRSLLQTTGRMVWLAAVPLLVTAALTIFLLILPRLFSNDNTDAFLIVVNGTLVITMAIWGSVWLIEFRRTSAGWIRPQWDRIREFSIYAWPLLPAFFAGYLSDWGDHLLVQAYFSNQEVGLFQAAYQVYAATLSLLSPISTVVLPRLISKSMQDTETVIQYLTKIVPTIMSLWALAVFPLITILPTVFVWILGAKYAEATNVLIILITLIPGAVVTYLYSVLYSLQGRLGTAMVFNALVPAVDLSVSYFLLPRIGIIGAAFGTCLSFFVSQSLYMIDQHRYLKVTASKTWLLYGLLVFFGFAQALAGDGLIGRSIICIAVLALFIPLIRYRFLVDVHVLSGIFSGQLNKVGKILQRVLVMETLPK